MRNSQSFDQFEFWLSLAHAHAPALASCMRARTAVVAKIVIDIETLFSRFPKFKGCACNCMSVNDRDLRARDKRARAALELAIARYRFVYRLFQS